RSFGESPELVSMLAVALLRGLQSAGVAATAKHFPGHGDTASDSHYGTPLITHSLERLREVEFPPFRAAIEAGVKMVMTAHIAVPVLDQGSNLPATLSNKILGDVLRQELNFTGVITTDAMDMQAVNPNNRAGIDEVSVAAVIAGADLLLLTTHVDQAAIYAKLLSAVQNGRISKSDFRQSANRIAVLKAWIAAQPDRPALDVIGSSEHHQLAAEVADRAITLVKDDAHLLPLHLSVNDRVAVIMPQPQDLTPADTSSYSVPDLAKHLRVQPALIDQFSMPIDPTDTEVASLLEMAQPYDLIIVGTINATAHQGQAVLVNQLLKQPVKTIAVALRLPYDLQAYPTAPTYVCTYSILDPAMAALTKALLGEIHCSGRLPVSIEGLFPIGHKVKSE
ncbi:MAG TPA: glycoside hydrolase family 3 N-terminal domain-containing protein, partial [Anaerolineae bacterium]|nr:glycoside hydrolase family 3 N-terminal domain-containing protein [Anaerolineae bacterium]